MDVLLTLFSQLLLNLLFFTIIKNKLRKAYKIIALLLFPVFMLFMHMVIPALILQIKSGFVPDPIGYAVDLHEFIVGAVWKISLILILQVIINIYFEKIFKPTEARKTAS